MSRSLTFVFPGDLALNTGGYAYDRRVIAGLEALGWTVTLLGLGDGFPAPSADVLRAAEARLSALADDTLVLIDGLAFGVLDDWASRHGARLRIAALVHHPLALETGLTPAEQAIVAAQERRALSFARHVIVTSAMTAREIVDHYGVDPSLLTVALPGTEPAGLAAGGGDPPNILSVGSLTRRKGHDVLVHALKAIEDLPWSATIIGNRTLDPATSETLAALVDALGLGERIVLLGDIADPRPIMREADIFALASRYEGYGMVFAEALSHGLPIVACSAGAVPEVVPDEAGFLVPVDDIEAFADALSQLVSDPVLRQSKAAAARQAGQLLPTWQATSSRVSHSLEALA